MTKKGSLISSSSLKKDFSYSKGACSLRFTLAIDNSSEVRDFKAILEAAVRDMDEILKITKN